MKNILLILTVLFLGQASGYGQLNNRPDTIKYVGEETTKQKKSTVKNGKLKNMTEIKYSKSFIKLNPDSTYEQKDYYSDTRSFDSSIPLTKTGFWIKKKNRIYFYSTREVVGSEWTDTFIINKDKLKYLWKKSFSKTKVKIDKSAQVFDKIYGIKPVTRYKKIK